MEMSDDFKMEKKLSENNYIDNEGGDGDADGEGEDVVKMLGEGDNKSTISIEVTKSISKVDGNDLQKASANLDSPKIEKNITRYTRSILHQIRNQENSRNRPSCILKGKLQLLSIWTCRIWKTPNTEGQCDSNFKSVCYENSVEDSGGGADGGNKSVACIKDAVNCEGFGHNSHNNNNNGNNCMSLKPYNHVPSDASIFTGNNKQRQVRSTICAAYHRGRMNSLNVPLVNSTTSVNNYSNNNFGSNHNNGGQSHNINSNAKYFLDQRSISSAHLMPAFAKKYMRSTVTANYADIGLLTATTKQKNNNNDSNGKGNENNQLPPLHSSAISKHDDGDAESLSKYGLDSKNRSKSHNKLKNSFPNFIQQHKDNTNGEPHTHWTPLLNRLQTKLSVPYKNNNNKFNNSNNTNSNNDYNTNTNNNSKNNNKDKVNSNNLNNNNENDDHNNNTNNDNNNADNNNDNDNSNNNDNSSSNNNDNTNNNSANKNNDNNNNDNTNNNCNNGNNNDSNDNNGSNNNNSNISTNNNNNNNNGGHRRSERRIGSGRLVNRENNWDYRTNSKEKNHYHGGNNLEYNGNNGDGTENGNSVIGRLRGGGGSKTDRDSSRIQDRLHTVERRPYDRRLLDGCNSILREKYENKDSEASCLRRAATNTANSLMNSVLMNTKGPSVNNKCNDDNIEMYHINMESNMNARGNHIYQQTQTQSHSQPLDTHLIQRTMSFRRSHQPIDKKDNFKLKEKKREEPEWFTSGPTTQHETIPLHGFHGDGDIGALNLTSKSNAYKKISSVNTNDKGKTIQDISLLNTQQNDQMHSTTEESLQSIMTVGDNSITGDIVASSTSEIISGRNPLNVETNIDFNHNKSSSNSVNELLNFFDMDSLEYSLIEAGKHKSFGQGTTVTSRFSRWFTKSDKANTQLSNDVAENIEVAKDDAKNEASFSDVTNKENNNKTNTVMAFFKSNDFTVPEMPKALPQSVLALSVEELESRMRPIDNNNENINSNIISLDGITKRDDFSGDGSLPPMSRSNTNASKSSTSQDVEIFKHLLNQLGRTVGNTEKSLDGTSFASSPYHAPPPTNRLLTESCNLDADEIDAQNNMHTTTINLKQKDTLKQQQQQQLYQQKLRQIQQQHKSIPIVLQDHDNENRMTLPHHTLPLQSHYNQHYLSSLSNINHQSNHSIGQKQDTPVPLDMHIHAQSLRQNSLIKKPLEEIQQEELFMTRWQELPDHQQLQKQRQTRVVGGSTNNIIHSPDVNFTADSTSSNNNGNQNLMQQQQPFRVHVCSSPTPMAFTPTSVLRKMTAEKDNFQQQQVHMLQQQQKHQQSQGNAHQLSIDPLINQDHLKSCILQQQQQQQQQQHTRLSHPRLILGGGGNGNNVNIQCQQQQAQSTHLQHQQLSTKMQQMSLQQQPTQMSPQHIQHQHQTKVGNQGRNGPLLKWSPAPMNSNILAVNKPIGRPILKGPPLASNTIPSNASGHTKTHLSTPLQPQQQMSKLVQLSQAQQQQPQQQHQQQFPLLEHMAGVATSNKVDYQLLPKIKTNPTPFNVQHTPMVVGNVCQQSYQSEHNADHRPNNNNIRQTSDHLVHHTFSTMQLQQQQKQQQQQQQQQQQHHHQQQLIHQRSLALKQKLHQQTQHNHYITQQDGCIILEATNSTQQQGVTASLNTTPITNLNYQRDGRLSPTSNQLAQWFSPELLAQASAGKLPLLNMNQALSLEEFERSIQHSSSTVIQN